MSFSQINTRRENPAIVIRSVFPHFLFFYHSPFPVPCLSEQNHYHGIRSCSNLPTHPRLILSSLRLLLLPFASLPTHSAECRTCQKRKEKSSLYHVKCTLFPSIFPYFCSVLFCSCVHVYSVGQGHRAAQLFSLILMWL